MYQSAHFIKMAIDCDILKALSFLACSEFLAQNILYDVQRPDAHFVITPRTVDPQSTRSLRVTGVCFINGGVGRKC